MEKISYFKYALGGAILGAILGCISCTCLSIIFAKNGTIGDSTAGIGDPTDIYLMFVFTAVMGVVIGPIVAYFENKEIDRLNEEKRKRLEYETECNKIKNQISSAFRRTGPNLVFAQDVLQCIENHKNSSDYVEVVNTEVSNYEDRIYNETIDAWSSGNFTAVESGLRMLSEACSSHEEYRTALMRLEDKKKLLTVMEQSGLPKSSPLMKRFSYMFDETILWKGYSKKENGLFSGMVVITYDEY